MHREWLATAAVVALAGVVGVLHITRRPDLNFNMGYVTGEDGNQLYRADRLNGGAMLYRDVACQYGYIPAHLYAVFTRIAGNTIMTNRVWHLLTSLVCVGMMFRLLRTSAPLIGAMAATLLVAVPFLLVPGGVLGTYTTFEHTSLERMCLLGLMLSWTPPDHRTARVALTQGLVLGLWQGIKFGGAFFAGAALIAVDVIWLLRTSGNWRAWLRRELVALAAFVAVEALWIALAVSTLSPDLAFDTLWPAYIGRAYVGLEGLGWHGAAEFVGRLMVPFTCAVLGSFALVRWISSGTTRAPATFIGLFFYAFASAGYFGHVHLFYLWAWAVVPAGIAGLVSLSVAPRLAFSVALLPAFLLMLKIACVNVPSPELTPATLPTGERIWATSADAAVLSRFAELPREPGFVLGAFGWGGGGFHFYFNRAYGLRNPMVTWPAFRPYDVDDLERNLSRISGVVMLDAERPAFERVLSPHVAREIGERFPVTRTGDGLTVLLADDVHSSPR
jgi:hypothetical protein